MNAFDSKNFIKSLKERYDAIPFGKRDETAKVKVSESIKANGYSCEDVYGFLYKSAGLSSTLTDADWKKIIDSAIKGGYPVAKNLVAIKSVLKGKYSNEELFNAAAQGYGANPIVVKNEILLDEYGWKKVVESIIKSEEQTKVEKKSVTKTVAKKHTKGEKKSIKVAMASKSKPITLINEVTGEIKTWESYKACEVELYNDPERGHGTVSQAVKANSDGRHINKVWKLYKGEAHAPEKKEQPKRSYSRGKSINQVVFYKDGSKVVVRTFDSITDASKATGIPYYSISKCANGTKGYHTTGGFGWDYAEVGA